MVKIKTLKRLIKIPKIQKANESQINPVNLIEPKEGSKIQRDLDFKSNKCKKFSNWSIIHFWEQEKLELPDMPFLSLKQHGWRKKKIETFRQWAPCRAIYYTTMEISNANFEIDIEPNINPELILIRVCSVLQELIGGLYSRKNIKKNDPLQVKQEQYRLLLLWAYLEYLIPVNLLKSNSSKIKRFFFSIKRFVAFYFVSYNVLLNLHSTIAAYKFRKNEFLNFLLKESYSKRRVHLMNEFAKKISKNNNIPHIQDICYKKDIHKANEL